MQKERSKSHVIRGAVDVNPWCRSPQSVDAARPERCAGCSAAARPIGEPLVLHGHGVRDRQVREAAVFGEPATMITVVVRRYQCQLCNAVMTVVPRGVMPGLLYSASVIGWALALYGLSSQSMQAVRTAAAAGKNVGLDATGWPALRRWIARAWTLWPSVRAAPATFGQRERAARVATTLATYAPDRSPLACAAFVGAALEP